MNCPRRHQVHGPLRDPEIDDKRFNSQMRVATDSLKILFQSIGFLWREKL
jgi:hypothetical protein